MRIDHWAPEQITVEIEKKAMDRLAKAGELVAVNARSRVPVKTGKLRDSIRVTRLPGDPKQNIRVYAGNRQKDGPFYAHMIENGTKNMSARPFLRPALNGSRSGIMAIMENG